uniref:Putative ATP binding protein n=1 Tax=Linum usitatissimum TaxID=4006 RepID=A0A172MLK7_LINUS|nr:putative ATP binding protein [Linum usitatissimum]
MFGRDQRSRGRSRKVDEACELEMEAGKKEVAERDKVVSILERELEKTRTALGISNGKLKLKEEVAAAAMAAQKSAEQSLRLADIRATEFRNRMEELSRQLEAIDSGNRDRRKVRHRCWPWQSLRDSINNAGPPLPEIQALLP